MNRYVLLIILLFLYAIMGIDNNNSDKRRLSLIRWFSFFLILDSGLRNIAVGADTFNYFETFNDIKDISLGVLVDDWLSPYYYKDPFYAVFQKIFQYVFPHFRLFLIFVATLFFSSLGRFIYKNVFSLNKIVIAYTFYLGMFYGFFSITGIRQTIATAIILFAFELLTKKKIIWAALLTALAAQFHATAWIFFIAFPIPFISFKQFRNYLLPLSVLVIVLVFVFSKSIAWFVVDSADADQYRDYIHESNERFSWVVFSMYAIVTLAVYAFRKHLMNDQKMMRLMMLYIIGFMSLATMFIGNTAIRISMYFTFSMYALIPEIIGQIKMKSTYGLVVLVMAVLMAFSVSEYKFFWQPMQLPDHYGTSMVIQENTIFD